LKTLVIGYGNVGRGDDRAGVLAARRIESLRLPNVEVHTGHQLLPEWAEACAGFDRLVFLDATAAAGAVQLTPIQPCGAATPVRGPGHQLSPETLLGLVQRLFGVTPEAYLCTIPGQEFGYAECLSPQSQSGVDEAAERVTCLIRDGWAEGGNSKKPGTT
jgi:hydrogenase maturation protease